MADEMFSVSKLIAVVRDQWGAAVSHVTQKQDRGGFQTVDIGLAIPPTDLQAVNNATLGPGQPLTFPGAITSPGPPLVPQPSLPRLLPKDLVKDAKKLSPTEAAAAVTAAMKVRVKVPIMVGSNNFSGIMMSQFRESERLMARAVASSQFNAELGE